MVRTGLASGLVALLCMACDVPRYGLGDPPPPSSAAEDADAPDAYVPVSHLEAGAGSTADAADAVAPIVKEAGIADARGMEANAPDSGAPTDAADDDSDEDDGDDPSGEGQGRGGDLRVEAH